MITGVRAPSALLLGAGFAILLVAVGTGLPLVAAAGVAVVTATVLSLLRSDETTLIVTRMAADRLVVAAAMLLAVAAVARASADAGPAVALAGLAVVVLGCWSGVAVLVVALSTRHPVYGVRNISAPSPPRLLTDAAGKARTAAIVFGALTVLGVAAVAAFSDDIALVWIAAAVLAAVALVAAAAMIAPALQAARRGPSDARALVSSLKELAPQAVVHLSGEARKAPYILGQWLPALEALNLRTIIVVREPTQLPAVPPTSLPVVVAKSGRDVSSVIVPSVRVAFYLANGAVNGDLLREPLVRHVFLNHGDSDKATSANPFNRVYDELWVAGDAAIRRYAAAGIDIAPDRFTIVGRPQLESLPTGPRPDPTPTTVFYAPTFEGYFEEANYSSLEQMGPAVVRALLEHRPAVRVLFKAHPSTGHQRAGMVRARHEVEDLLRSANAAGGAHVIVDGRSRTALYEALSEADVLISDVSSVMTDFLWTQRPVIATNPRGLDHAEVLARFPTHAAGYLLDPGGDVGALLTSALTDDPKREDRRRVRDDVLGNPPGGATAAFVAAADRAYAAAVAHAERVQNTFSLTQP